MNEISKKILSYNTGRLEALLQVKYAAMCENAFRFFRGSCHLFYERLKGDRMLHDAPKGWICGDLHLENFGSFRGGNQLTYFDLNDFDEAIRAPVLFEVIRLMSAILIAFQVLEIDADQGINMALLFLRRYRSTLGQGKPLGIEPRTARGIVCDFLKKAGKSTAKDLLKKRTYKKGSGLYLDRGQERHLKLKKKLKSRLKTHIKDFLAHSSVTPYNFAVRDVVFRVAGTGSLGQRRYLFLLQNKKENRDYLLLDMKEALPGALESVFGPEQPCWDTPAERITTVQDLMQHVTAAMLDTTEFQGRSYVIQELQPVKDTLKFKLIRDDYRDIIQVIDDMAVLTASAQLRSSGRLGVATADEFINFAKKMNCEQELLRLAQRSCEQTHRDYYAFLDDYHSGELLSKTSLSHETLMASEL